MCGNVWITKVEKNTYKLNYFLPMTFQVNLRSQIYLSGASPHNFGHWIPVSTEDCPEKSPESDAFCVSSWRANSGREHVNFDCIQTKSLWGFEGLQYTSPWTIFNFQ